MQSVGHAVSGEIYRCASEPPMAMSQIAECENKNFRSSSITSHFSFSYSLADSKIQRPGRHTRSLASFNVRPLRGRRVCGTFHFYQSVIPTGSQSIIHNPIIYQSLRLFISPSPPRKVAKSLPRQVSPSLRLSVSLSPPRPAAPSTRQTPWLLLLLPLHLPVNDLLSKSLL